MIRVFLLLCFSFVVSTQVAFAQSEEDIAWVQIEAQPSLTIAQQRAQLYGQDMQDVNGFALGGGWYAVALGPYTRVDAENVLRVYRSEGMIPTDSFLSESNAFQSQFWPVGANLLNLPIQVRPQIDASVTTISTVPEPEPEPEPIDETPREARASEAELDRDQRKELQSWLQWAGYYNSAIDGAIGRGTRASMSAWQADNGYETTGVLTTRQRAELRQQYYAVLEGMDLRMVSNLTAGMELMIPMGVVKETATEFPFVRYEASGDVPASVLLISQAGDQNTLFGLYDIMQTLEIVPLEGERTRKEKSFVLTGKNREIVSHTEVSLEDGQIKGFTLVWPVGDEERRTRILGEMQNTYARLDGVLDPAAGSDAEQNLDLLSGLEIRRPRLSRSGFFVNESGVVVTTSDAVDACTRVTLENDYPVDVIFSDDATGVAILRPATKLAPMQVASLRSDDARLHSDIAVAGYSYEGVLGAPTLTFGTLADIKGLGGEAELKRLSLKALPGDAGGPVLDSKGSVMGMLLSKPSKDGPALPADVSFALGSEAILAMLSDKDVALKPASADEEEGALPPEDLTRIGGDMTVLVSCWD